MVLKDGAKLRCCNHQSTHCVLVNLGSPRSLPDVKRDACYGAGVVAGDGTDPPSCRGSRKHCPPWKSTAHFLNGT